MSPMVSANFWPFSAKSNACLKLVLPYCSYQRCRFTRRFHSPGSSIYADISRSDLQRGDLAPYSKASLYQKSPRKIPGSSVAFISPIRTYASRRFTRQERIDEARYTSQSNLDKIDEIFGVYGRNVTKVVDLGSAPGTWLRHTRNRLSGVHGLKPEKIYEKCTVIGVDLLFCQPPRGTFFTQGNMYSQNTHTQIETLLKEAAFRIARPKRGDIGTEFDISYISRELNQVQLEANIATEKTAQSTKATKQTSDCYDLPPYAHQADVVLSDLGTPPLQESGFHINTLSKPFIRSSSNNMLRQPWDNPEKSSIDLAEAALLLSGNVLAKGGTFVVRLSMVNLADPELELLEARLRMVFHRVTRWSDNGRTTSTEHRQQNLFMVCKDKKDHLMDKYAVFGVPRD